MSLRVELTGIENYKEVCWEPVEAPKEGGFLFVWGNYRDEKTGQHYAWRPTMAALVNMMPLLGIKGRITTSNVEEAVKQVAILQRVSGPWLRKITGEPVWVTDADVRRYVGLYTNASYNGKREFRSYIWTQLEKEAVSWIESQAKQQEGK